MFTGVGVRALCRPLKLSHSNIGKPCRTITNLTLNKSYKDILYCLLPALWQQFGKGPSTVCVWWSDAEWENNHWLHLQWRYYIGLKIVHFVYNYSINSAFNFFHSAVLHSFQTMINLCVICVLLKKTDIHQWYFSLHATLFIILSIQRQTRGKRN